MALGAEEVPVTFGELAASVDAFAAGLRGLGVGVGSVVGYSLPNCPEAISLFLALARIGACALPLFPAVPDSIRCATFTASRASLVVAAGPSAKGLAQAAEQARAPFKVVGLEECAAAEGDTNSWPARPEQPLILTASSGTTGISKPVLLTHKNVAASVTAARELARFGPWRDTGDFTCVIAFPLSTSGVLVLLGHLLEGVRLVFSRDLSPMRFCALAAHWRADVLAAPPSFFEAILTIPASALPPLPEARAVTMGMDFLTPSLLTRLKRRFPSMVSAANGYGLVETSTVFMTWKANAPEELTGPASVLTLCSGVDNRVAVRDDAGHAVADGEIGELWATGPSVVSGYLDPGLQQQGAFVEGWFRKGDIVRKVDERTVELLGRRKYVIKRGGRSVSPIEVQDCLNLCAGVKLSAVVGVPHPLYGEMIWAFVVPEQGQEPSLGEIMKHCRAALPNYMVPDQVSPLGELPRGRGVGKVDNERLIAIANETLKGIEESEHG